MKRRFLAGEFGAGLQHFRRLELMRAIGRGSNQLICSELDFAALVRSGGLMFRHLNPLPDQALRQGDMFRALVDRPAAGICLPVQLRLAETFDIRQQLVPGLDIIIYGKFPLVRRQRSGG